MAGRMRNAVLGAGICAATLLTTGCGLVVLGLGAVGLAGYGTYKAGEATVGAAGSAAEKGWGGVKGVFSYGDYTVRQEGSVAEVWSGAKEAFGMMNFSGPSGRYDALGGELHGLASDGRSVIVRIEAVSPDSTKLAIRVGTNGDKDQSVLVHRYIGMCMEPSAAEGPAQIDKT